LPRKFPEPDGLRLVKEKLELAKTRMLTVEDGREVRDSLDKCCDKHPRICGYREECRKLDNKLSDYLPPDIPRPASTYEQPREYESCWQGTLHSTTIRVRMPKASEVC
jgi:hypothetical protein